MPRVQRIRSNTRRLRYITLSFGPSLGRTSDSVRVPIPDWCLPPTATERRRPDGDRSRVERPAVRVRRIGKTGERLDDD